MERGRFKSLADLFLPLLDSPEDLNAVMIFVYKLLLDIYRFKYSSIKDLPAGFTSGDPEDSTKLTPVEISARVEEGWIADLIDMEAAGLTPVEISAREEERWMSLINLEVAELTPAEISTRVGPGWITELLNLETEYPNAADALNNFDLGDVIEHLCKRLGEAITQKGLFRPDTESWVLHRLTGEEFLANSGKLFLLETAADDMTPTSVQWLMLSDIIKMKPVILFWRKATSIKQREEYGPRRFYELNHALKNLLSPDTTVGDPQDELCLPSDGRDDAVIATGAGSLPLASDVGSSPAADRLREDLILRHLLYFVWLGMNVCDVWTYFEEPTGDQYQFGLVETKNALNRVLRDSKRKLPPKFRTALCRINLCGAWDYIWRFVRYCRHGQLTPLPQLGWKTYDMIMRVSQYQDHGGIIKGVIEKYTEQRSDYLGRPNFRPMGEHVHINFARYTPAMRYQEGSRLDPMDETESIAHLPKQARVGIISNKERFFCRQLQFPLVSVGPRIDVARHTQIITAAIVGEKCPICLDQLQHDLPLFCVTITRCEHRFHLPCLEKWVNGPAPGSNTCPKCYEAILRDAREYPIWMKLDFETPHIEET